jgi:hypothetical protein
VLFWLSVSFGLRLMTKSKVCIKFLMKISKFPTETLQMLCDAFGKHSLSWTAVFERLSHFKAGGCKLKLSNVQGDQVPAKRQKMAVSQSAALNDRTSSTIKCLRLSTRIWSI